MDKIEELTISAYDVEVMRNREAEKKRKHERAMERWRTFASIGIAVAVMAGICGAIYLLWQANAGPSASEQEETKVRIACINAGGTWAKVSSSSTDYGTCFGPIIQSP